MVIANNKNPEKPPCKTCGHPGPFVPKVITGQKDPRKSLKILCKVCTRDLTYDTHQWQDDKSKRYVCCDCMAYTKSLRDVTGGGR